MDIGADIDSEVVPGTAPADGIIEIVCTSGIGGIGIGAGSLKLGSLNRDMGLTGAG